MEESSETAAALKRLYKCKNNFCSTIKERRDDLLEKQKERRHQLIDQNRQQFANFINTPDDDGTEEMEYEELQNKEKKFKFKLMNTDWFTDIPDDLEENWLVKGGPAGFRIMLVARKKLTTGYSNKGRSVLKLKSNFPGGGGEKDMHCGTTVLDCIYNKVTKTIFVLDCLCWNNMLMIDSEAEFRFFWLKSKFKEDLELTSCRHFKFVLIDCIPAQRSLIQDSIFESCEFNGNRYYYDGIVFYHKASHYFFGDTPLVGWLASFMLTEMLHIDVPQEHLIRMPEDYKGVDDYIKNFSTKKKRERKKYRKCAVAMEVT